MTAMDPIVTALEKMEGRLIARIDEANRELRRDIQLDMDGQFDAVHKRLDRLEQEYEMLKVGMARLEADVGTLKSDVAQLKADVAQLKTTVGRIEARMERDLADRKDLRQQAVEFGRRLDDLEGRVQAMEDRFPTE
jgi:chromosome segregation ATPase